MLVIKQFGPVTYAMGTLQEILAGTGIAAKVRALPNDVAGCTLEMGADGLWTGNLGTLTQAQADALVAAGVMGKVRVGTAVSINEISATLAKNLLVPNTTTSGFIDEVSGGITQSSTYFTSDFIPVTPSVYSFATMARFVAFFNSSKTIIGLPFNTELKQRINVPASCSFMRVTFRESNRASAGVYKGDSASIWAYKSVSANAVTIGGCTDSLGGTGWQSIVTSNIGAIMALDVAGGTQIAGDVSDATAMCNDTRALAPSIYSRFLILMGGTNDWAHSIPLGTPASTDQTTFYGALNVLLAKWTSKYVDSRILLVTTNYGNMPSRVTTGQWTDPEVNTQGLRTTDYAAAIRDRAAYWGCSIVDCARDCGINNGNKSLYIKDEGNYLHHNAKGIRRIAKIVTDTISGFIE